MKTEVAHPHFLGLAWEGGGARGGSRHGLASGERGADGIDHMASNGGDSTLVGARVLVAEDGREIRALLSVFLRGAGAVVTAVGDGRAAVEAVGSGGGFDLVLMDLEMPELDGYAATRELRARGCGVPIVALTAHSAADEGGRCRAAGFTGHLTKPIDRAALLAAVREVLGAPVGCGESAGGAGERDDGGVGELVREFVSHLPGQVAGLRAELARREPEALRRRLHQLQGAGGSYGFGAITEAAAGASRALPTGDWAGIGEAVGSLIALLRGTRGYDTSREVAHAGAEGSRDRRL